jgi:hypothetical protein
VQLQNLNTSGLAKAIQGSFCTDLVWRGSASMDWGPPQRARAASSLAAFDACCSLGSLHSLSVLMRTQQSFWHTSEFWWEL